ncbi:SAM-dependent methyltransferase [Rhizomicrobium palustre]|uniref:SAM-dependent methyltransferase n=1 Tax=Rhizomicrobium palustre TaxID=189966 RepID=A0A846MUL3_9PROT|nr:class I SAM-dependent methyltransferase [Rhizomicrobium palustre]NIK86891.1 SAM-dependent methyltransferase [Rhizomicrobium palustre]
MGGNLYDKYNARNPVAAYLMRGFLQSFDQLTAKVPVGAAVEVGCGEGELIRRLALRGWQTTGFDVSPDVIAIAKERAARAGATTTFFSADIHEVAVPPADLLLCCEVLEHVEQPGDALDKLSKAAPFALFSVPREPVWRVLNMLRGAYWSDWGNTPGHIQHWSATGFLDFLSSRYTVMEVRRPLPWTMALCRSRA